MGDDPSASTEPTHYAVTGTQLFLYPTPSANESGAVVCYFYTIPVDLVAGSPVWATQFHHILVDYGCYRVHEREEYFEESRDAYDRFTRTLKDMIRWYNSRTLDNPLIYGDGGANVWDERLHLQIW